MEKAMEGGGISQQGENKVWMWVIAAWLGAWPSTRERGFAVVMVCRTSRPGGGSVGRGCESWMIAMVEGGAVCVGGLTWVFVGDCRQ